MRNSVRFLFIVSGVMALFAAKAPWAASIETLVMPGPVIEGHAKYETSCSRCHARFSKSTQSTLCLDCHDEVRFDIEEIRGYHGRIQDIKNTECRSCHTEHQGRDADVLQLDTETFDHRATDFPLKGLHRKVRCERCHATQDKYRDAPTECLDCHEKDDPHKGRLGEDCGECHVERDWQETRFDHDTTDFPLEGKHEEVTCNSCHPNERYEKTPTQCFACHRLNDVHAGHRGEQCDSCHTPEDWEETVFDHDHETDFPLEGRHRRLSCEMCHNEGMFEKELDGVCYTCHENDDEHKGRHGRECDQCHAPDKWTRVDFDHEKETDFTLRGEHKRLECRACHKGALEDEELDTTCFTCHRGDDVHVGQEGEQCDRCHDERGWTNHVVFEHDVTRFPLIGLHAVVPCEQCHLSPAFKDTRMECFSCHEVDDSHELRFGNRCGSCHNPNGWALWRFDHNSRTDFVLDGSHQGMACHACHRAPVSDQIELARTCGGCHQGDDVHLGRFGRNCQRCHVTDEFARIRYLR